MLKLWKDKKESLFYDYYENKVSFLSPTLYVFKMKYMAIESQKFLFGNRWLQTMLDFIKLATKFFVGAEAIAQW